jgi:hypothetical protein
VGPLPYDALQDGEGDREDRPRRLKAISGDESTGFNPDRVFKEVVPDLK